MFFRSIPVLLTEKSSHRCSHVKKGFVLAFLKCLMILGVTSCENDRQNSDLFFSTQGSLAAVIQEMKDSCR